MPCKIENASINAKHVYLKSHNNAPECCYLIKDKGDNVGY